MSIKDVSHSMSPKTVYPIEFLSPRELPRTSPLRIRVVNALFNFYGLNITSSKASSMVCAVFNLIFIAYTGSRLVKHTMAICSKYNDFFALVNIIRYLAYVVSRINLVFHLKKLIKLYNLVRLSTLDIKLGRAIICIPIIWLLAVTLHFIFYLCIVFDHGVAGFMASYHLKVQPGDVHIGHRILSIVGPLLYCLLDVSWFTFVALIKVLIGCLISRQKNRAIRLLTNSVQLGSDESELRKHRSNWLEISDLDQLLNQVFEFSYFVWICYTFVSYSCLITTFQVGLYGRQSNVNSISSEIGGNLTESCFILMTVYFDYKFNREIDTNLKTLVRAESKTVKKNDELTELIEMMKRNAKFNLTVFSTFIINLNLVFKFFEALVPITVIIIQLKSSV